jgi:hypothetical protein
MSRRNREAWTSMGHSRGKCGYLRADRKGKRGSVERERRKILCSRLQDPRRDCRSVGMRYEASCQLQSVKVSLYVYKVIS